MKPLLEIEHLAKWFGGVKALQDLSFVVQPGEILGLIGPNGSGKSTCVNLISRIYVPDAGTIVFDGHTLTPKDSIRDRVHIGIGRTFQTPKPFGTMTVFENVYAVAMQHYDMNRAAAKAEDVLKRMNLYSHKDMISVKLPIEMRKWLDLARILVNDPKLIMMDEVMAGLNPFEMEESLKMIRRINESGITILFIEHVMRAVVQLCHRVVVINNGKLLAQGISEEVLCRKEVIDAYIGGEDDDQSA